MVYAYWILGGVLALTYLAAGGMKLSRPKEKLATSGMGWTEDFSPAGVKGIAIVELLGAVGLILPPLTHIAPILGPIAAVGLVIVQVLAGITHARRNETKMLVMNASLAVLALVVAVIGFMVWR
jgi:DoxX-like family